MYHRKQHALTIDGDRESGQDIRSQNVTAAVAVANIVKSSLGPTGLDKMMVDQIGDVTITNDGATILNKLEVEHPAGKVLVDLARLQDDEVGDGTTSVVIVAAELLKKANQLVKQKIHPTSIMSGYRLACREAVNFINTAMKKDVAALGRPCLISIAKTTMASKVLNAESEFFSNMAVDAITRIKHTNKKGKSVYNIKSINVLKSQGKSEKESVYVEGYALNCTVAAQGLKKHIEGAKIALLNFDLQKAKMGLGVNIVVNDPNKLDEIRRKEADIIKARLNLILGAGANVVLTTRGIDDLCLKYFQEAGAMAVRRVKKEDLRNIAKATGGTVVTSLANLDSEETFDPEWLGQAGVVKQVRVADDELILIEDCKTSRTSSVILRGPNYVTLDEMERALHDVFCALKRTLESNAVVPGGGCVEAALSIYLENFATTLGSREQLAIAAFAEALMVIPKTLANNSALDATELVAKLRAHHHAAQTDASKKDWSMYGLDLKQGEIRNNFEAGVLEPSISKIKSIKFACEAAVTILRIDDMIKLNPRPPPPQRHH